MKVFTVLHNYATTDHESWQHWDENVILSYHTSEEGAKKKIAELVDKDVAGIEDMIRLNPTMSTANLMHYTRLASDNLFISSDSNEDEGYIEKTKYTVGNITVEE